MTTSFTREWPECFRKKKRIRFGEMLRGQLGSWSVTQDVQQCAEWIAHEKAAHSPRLIGGPVLDWNLCLSHASERGVEIIDLD